MSLEKSIPLTLNALGNGAVNAIPSSQENYYAQSGAIVIISEFPSGDSAYYGSLSTDPTNSSIGSYTDTFYNEPVGTHPASSLSIGSTTTTLYQNKGDSVDVFAEWHRTVAADSSGDIYEMDSDSFYRWGYRLLETALTNEETGCFRINSTIPGSEYEVYKSALFQDNVTSGSTDYNLYRKKSIGNILYPPPTFYTLQLKDSDAHHIKEMQGTTAVRSAYFAMRHAEQKSGLGDYLLLSDSDGSPADQGYTGTWEARGVALDTKHQTGTVQYLGTFTTQFTGQYTGNFTGQYTGFSVSPFSANYSGVRTVTFTGIRSYTGQFGGSRNYASVTGQYGGSRNYGPAQYAGTRVVPQQFSGSRNYTSVTGQYGGSRNYAATYSGSRNYAGNYGGSRNYSASYAGDRSVASQFTGARPATVSVPGQFAGNRTFAGIRPITRVDFVDSQFAGTRNVPFSTQYIGTRQVTYAGTRTVGPSQFLGTDTFTRGYTANFVGFDNAGTPTEPDPVRNYSSVLVKYDGVAPKNYAGQRVVPVQDLGPSGPIAFAGSRVASNFPQQFTGVRTLYYAGTRNIQFTGERTFAGSRLVPVVFPGTFSGVRVAPNSFSGSRNYAGTYGGSRNYASVTGQYGGSRNYSAAYAGSRNYSTNYLGVRTVSQNFTGNRNYSGTYSGSRNYSDQYVGVRNFTGDFLGPLPGSFSGERQKDFTAEYSGTYSTQFTGQYTGSFSSNFSGETILAATETIHTYTLYCRISES